MAVRQSKSGETVTIGKMTLAQPYLGVIPLLSGSGAVANQPASAQLLPTPTSCAYLSSFSVTGTGATAANAVVVAVNGLMGGATRTYAYCFSAGINAPNQPLILRFDPPLQGDGLGAPITITCPSSGAGGLINCVNAHGYASTLPVPASI